MNKHRSKMHNMSDYEQCCGEKYSRHRKWGTPSVVGRSAEKFAWTSDGHFSEGANKVREYIRQFPGRGVHQTERIARPQALALEETARRAG